MSTPPLTARLDARASDPPAAPSTLLDRLGSSPTWRALAHDDYRRWAGAGLVSSTGAWMQLVAQNWLVLQQTGSGAALGITVALQALPGLTLGLWGGLVADRFPRRRILLVTQGLLALLALTQAVLLFGGGMRAWMLPVFALLAGLVGVFDGPANGTFGAQLVPDEDLSNALALGTVAGSVARVVGMGAAGVLVAAVGPAVAFAVNALTFVPVLVVLARLHEASLRPIERAVRARGQVRAGLRHVLTSGELRATLALAFVLGALGRNYQVTMALMADGVFAAGAGAYGALSLVFALGALAGAFVAARIRTMDQVVLLVAAAASGLAELACAAAPSLVAFGGSVFAAAIAAVVLDTAVGTRVQLSTGEALRGRVVAVAGLVSAATGAVGGPALGGLSAWGGPRLALAVGGAACLTAVALLARPVAGRGIADLARVWVRQVRPVPVA